MHQNHHSPTALVGVGPAATPGVAAAAEAGVDSLPPFSSLSNSSRMCFFNVSMLLGNCFHMHKRDIRILLLRDSKTKYQLELYTSKS